VSYRDKSRPRLVLGFYGSGFERAAVGNFRQIIDALALARLDGGISVRELARVSGVGTTTVSDLLTGAGWGRWPSLIAVAATLGQVLTVTGDPDVLGSLTLAARRRPQSMSRRQFADYASLRPNTLYECAVRWPRRVRRCSRSPRR